MLCLIEYNLYFLGFLLKTITCTNAVCHLSVLRKRAGTRGRTVEAVVASMERVTGRRAQTLTSSCSRRWNGLQSTTSDTDTMFVEYDVK